MNLTTQMRQVIRLVKQGLVCKDKGKAVLTHLVREQQEIDRLHAEAMVMAHNARVRAGL